MKKNSKGGFSLSGENKRWFKVKEVKGIEQNEWVLSYFSSQRSKEAKGYIYLRDVSSISSPNDSSLTIASPARTMEVSIETPAEHRMWLEGLVELCPKADLTHVKTTLTYRHRIPSTVDGGSKGVPAEREEEATRAPLSAPGKASSAPRAPAKSDSDSASSERDEGTGDIATDARVSKERLDRTDHRKTGLNGASGQGATSRLHGHIRKDPELAVFEKRKQAQRVAEVKEDSDARGLTGVGSGGVGFDVNVTPQKQNEKGLDYKGTMPDTPNIDDMETMNLDVRASSEYATMRRLQVSLSCTK